MANDDDLEPVSARLAYLFKRVQLELGRLHEELLAPFDVTAGELAILILIQARGPESQQQVARRLGIDRTTMVDVIDALEDKGLVARQPDPADRRRKTIVLTSAGRRVTRSATRASDQAEQRLLADLDHDEAEQLRGLLRRIAIPADR